MTEINYSDHNMIFSSFSDKFVSLRSAPLPQKKVWDLDENTDFTKFKQVVQRELDLLVNCGPDVEGLASGLTKVFTKGSMRELVRKPVYLRGKRCFPSTLLLL